VVAQRVREAIDARRVLEYYGYKVNRQGLTICPFHNEKTASLKVYAGDRGWYCFGCGQNGSVIDFVMKIFNLNLSSAITRLNYDFNLGLGFGKPNFREMQAHNKKKKEEAEIKLKKEIEYMRKLIEFKIYYRILHDRKPSKYEQPSEEYIQALLRVPQLEEWLLGGGDYD